MSDSSPRILVTSFAPFPAATGDATRLAQRITAFAEAGYSLDVLTPKTPDLPHVSKLLGARILRVPMPSGRENSAAQIPRANARAANMDESEPAPLAVRYATFERAVRRQLSGNEYDVVHTFEPFSALAVLEMKGLARVVFEAGGGTPTGEGDEALGHELRRREREVFRLADIVLVATDEVALRAFGLGAPRRQVHVLRPSADLDLFRPPSDRRRRQSSPVRLVLCAATLSPRELTLIAEALHLVPSLLEIELTLSAALTPQARRQISADEELAPRLKHVVPVLYEDLGPYYQKGDLGLVVSEGPIRGELPPVRLQAIAEMMASGLALVLPDVPAVREIVEDGRHALLVPPADPEALANAIRVLVTQPPRRRLLGHAARARAADLLDERRGTAQLLGLYASLLSPSISISASAFLETNPASPSSFTPSHVDADISASSPTGPDARVPPGPDSALLPPRRQGPRPPLKHAAEPDAPTDPDLAIQRRVSLADLSSAAQTDPHRPHGRR